VILTFSLLKSIVIAENYLKMKMQAIITIGAGRPVGLPTEAPSFKGHLKEILVERVRVSEIPALWTLLGQQIGSIPYTPLSVEIRKQDKKQWRREFGRNVINGRFRTVEDFFCSYGILLSKTKDVVERFESHRQSAPLQRSFSA
jgi:hypothetical protein